MPPKEPDDLSAGAIDKRLRRLMARRADGSRLVPEELYEEWKNLETRDGVLRQFEMCGWSRETSLKSGLLLSNLKFQHMQRNYMSSGRVPQKSSPHGGVYAGSGSRRVLGVPDGR